MKNPFLAQFSKEELVELIELYCKEWLAMDGVWFQSIEQKYGMAEAMEHDANAWRRFTRLEAQKIKKFKAIRQHQRGRNPAARQSFDLPHPPLPGTRRPPAERDAVAPLQAGGFDRI